MPQLLNPPSRPRPMPVSLPCAATESEITITPRMPAIYTQRNRIFCRPGRARPTFRIRGFVEAWNP